MEISEKFHPGVLRKMLTRGIFSHAAVPYRIKSYQAILADCYETIDFDEALDKQIAERVARIGTDGKLLCDRAGNVVHVSLTEKLLLLLLAKFCNFVPEGGIWMNTQRPEWNDANNALAGRGLSVVTLCYLRRALLCFQQLFRDSGETQFPLTKNVYDLFQAVQAALTRFRPLLSRSLTDTERRAMMDELGTTGSRYRQKSYQEGVASEVESLKHSELFAFFDLALQYIDHSILANKRADGLYHAYNTLQISEGCASIHELDEMLEGQVAVLSSGLLCGAEALNVLQALRASALYREDQHSYILYPDRDLAGFLQKNCLSEAQVKESELIAALVENGETTLIAKDVNNVYHFNGRFSNAKDVNLALEHLKKQPQYAESAEKEAGMILDLFETTFNHQSFTGRSGTFFAYEGLGSIYWHMVSKLLLAVQENYFQAVENAESGEVLQRLADMYYDVRRGIGFNKPPDEYGAFPTDPYSHTPSGCGARQPGMTGQVKEEILTRLGEMGLLVNEGKITFAPLLLRGEEFLTQPRTFKYIDVAGGRRQLELPAGALAYTFCQTPVVYLAASSAQIVIAFSDGRRRVVRGNCLESALSRHLFQRDGSIRQVTVYVEAGR